MYDAAKARQKQNLVEGFARDAGLWQGEFVVEKKFFGVRDARGVEEVDGGDVWVRVFLGLGRARGGGEFGDV